MEQGLADTPSAVAAAAEDVERTGAGGQPQRPLHREFREDSAILPVVNGDLVDAIGLALDVARPLRCLEDASALGDIYVRLARRRVAVAGHGFDPSVGPIDVQPVGPAGAERFAVGTVDVFGSAVGAEAPDALAVGAGRSAAACAARVEGAEELPHAQRLVQVEHRLVQAVFKVVPVEDGDAARGNVHVG